MIQHGIFTTKSDIWLHLFPLEGCGYWYFADEMRWFIRRHEGDTRARLRPGRSDDGTVTGGGYLIGKDEWLITRVVIPGDMLAEFDWQGTTDREFGAHHGETLAWWMLRHGWLRFNAYHVEKINGLHAQMTLGDFASQLMPRANIEVKTERFPNSPYLFVQSAEGGHKPCQVRGKRGRENRQTPLLPEDA